MRGHTEDFPSLWGSHIPSHPVFGLQTIDWKRHLVLEGPKKRDIFNELEAWAPLVLRVASAAEGDKHILFKQKKLCGIIPFRMLQKGN